MELVNSIIVEINNREFSILFWFFLLCLWVAFHKDVRSSFFSVLKAFFVPKILIPIFTTVRLKNIKKKLDLNPHKCYYCFYAKPLIAKDKGDSDHGTL